MRDNFLSKKNLIYFGFSFIIFILLNFKTPLFSNLLINIRLKWLDYLIQRKPERAPVKDLILINIDKDNSLQKYGRWPWNRLLFKKALDILTESGAKIVIFDFYLNQKTKEDQSLIQAVNKHKRVIFALPWDSASRMLSTPPENFLKSKAYFGHVIPGRIISDQFRGVALFIKTPIIQKIEYLSLSLMAVLLKDNLQNFPINFNDKNLIIGKYKIPLLKNEENLPLMLINFTGKRGNFRRHNQEYYYDELIERKISKEVFKDKIVLIYNSFEPNDQFLTPVSAEARIPGGEIHANAINTILQNDYIIPYFNSDIFIIILILINALIFYKFSYWRKRILLLLSLNIILLSSSIFLFKKNLWFDITSPFLISFIFSIFILTYENKKVKELFSQFLAPEVVNQLILKDKISLGGEEKEVSILFSDIRGYTNLSESISPEKVMQMLNEYHGEMNKIFQVNSGRVFDYQGDAQMVVFGAPLESKEHAYLAVKTALEMQKAMHELRKKWSLKEHQIEIGVGISTGIAAIGLVGDEKHKQYVALGDSTNIASRLQSLSKELNSPVLIAESTYLKIKSLISAVELPEVLLKGKSQSLKVYKAVRLNREV